MMHRTGKVILIACHLLAIASGVWLIVGGVAVNFPVWVIGGGVVGVLGVICAKPMTSDEYTEWRLQRSQEKLDKRKELHAQALKERG